MVKRRSMFVDVPRRWMCACLACDVASHVVVIVVDGGCEQMVMVVGVAAVGDGGDRVVLRCFQRWRWFVVVVAICIHGWSLFVVVVMGSHCCS